MKLGKNFLRWKLQSSAKKHLKILKINGEIFHLFVVGNSVLVKYQFSPNWAIVSVEITEFFIG